MRHYSNRKLWLGVVSSAAFVAMVFFLMSLESSPGIPRDKAIARALEESRRIGLTGEPTSVQAVATSYGSYRAFMNQPPSPVSGEASREVWIVSFTGEVDLRGCVKRAKFAKFEV
jgi:hypothetical protein